jgi:hypothetical protein
MEKRQTTGALQNGDVRMCSHYALGFWSAGAPPLSIMILITLRVAPGRSPVLLKVAIRLSGVIYEPHVSIGPSAARN